VNYDERTSVNGVMAWGHLTYSQPLTESQANDHDLVLKPDYAPASENEEQESKPEPKAPGAMSDTQLSILNALITSNAVGEEWVVLSEVCELPKKSIPGATRGLLAKGYIRTEWGKDKSGKKAAVATVTEGGIAALQAA